MRGEKYQYNRSRFSRFIKNIDVFVTSDKKTVKLIVHQLMIFSPSNFLIIYSSNIEKDAACIDFEVVLVAVLITK